MSTENPCYQFMSKVADSEELQAKIGEKIDANALIALGAECGYEFDEVELQEYAAITFLLLHNTVNIRFTTYVKYYDMRNEEYRKLILHI